MVSAICDVVAKDLFIVTVPGLTGTTKCAVVVVTVYSLAVIAIMT